MEVAVIVATLFLVAIWVFQIALAAGAPWGAAAWGGQSKGILPTSLRVSSGIAAAFIYPLIMLYVLVSAEVVAVDWLPGAGKVAMWGLVGFFALGTLMNLASRSKIERIWGPVSLVIAICCWIIVRGL